MALLSRLRRFAPAFLAASGLWLGGGLSRAPAMSVPKPTFAELVGKAETIARVEVIGESSRWDTTPTGQQVIHTYVDCKVLRTLKGVSQPRLTLRFLGGQVGAAVMQIPDMPRLAVGRRYVLFVAGNGRDFCPLVGIMNGKFMLNPAADGSETIAESGRGRDEFENAIVQQVQTTAAR